MNTATQFSDNDGINLIARERERQIMAEHYSSEHDDEHDDGSLANAAACYAITPAKRHALNTLRRLWPWDRKWWKEGSKTTEGRIRDLERAGALCAAEIDRLLRSQS